MAGALVSYDNDSSSESTSETEFSLKPRPQGEEVKQVSEFFSILPDDDDDSDQDLAKSSDQLSKSESCLKQEDQLPNPFASTVLPTPEFTKSSLSAGEGSSTSSVFVTAYRRAEDAKQSILERHVKMTTVVEEEPSHGRRQNFKQGVCRSFLKGSCRFGQRCRFSHCDPTNDTVTHLGHDASSDGLTTTPKWSTAHNSALIDLKGDDDEDGYNTQKKRTHRSGITDHLVPPKRAMTSLTKLREQERPWTMNK